MGTKAFLQKGRTKPGIVLPAAAANRVNEAKDRSALVRAAEREAAAKEHFADPLPNIGMSIAAKLEPVIDVPAETEQVKEVVSDALAVPAEQLDDPYAVAKDRMKQRIFGATAFSAEPNPVGGTTGGLSTLTVERAADPVPLPEPKEPPAEPEQLELIDEPSTEDDLTTLVGVGPTLATRLRNFGYRSFTDIGRADPQTLNEIQGAKGRGESWVAEARKLAGLI